MVVRGREKQHLDSQDAPGGSAAGGKSLFSFPFWRAACRAGKPPLCGLFGTPLQLLVPGSSVLTLPRDECCLWSPVLGVFSQAAPTKEFGWEGTF